MCRRCLTAFSSQDSLKDHIERCHKQQPTKLNSSWNDHLTFQGYHSKVYVRISVDFECFTQHQGITKVLIEHISIAVGYFTSHFGNQYYTYFGAGCETWIVNEMLFLGKDAKKYLKTNKQTTTQAAKFQNDEACWLCEEPFSPSR